MPPHAMRRRQALKVLGLSTAALTGGSAFAKSDVPVLVFAAASLTEALNEIGELYAKMGHARPVFNYGGSAVLARQIDQGAQADIFFAADEAWMDYLSKRQLIEPASRIRLLSNRLVLAAPADRPFKIDIKHGMDLKAALKGGKLSMADPDSVRGRYGKAALEKLGAWADIAKDVVRSDNVRAALRFVETGDAAAGVVYATDVKASAKVVVAGVFPESAHPKISYSAALIKGPRMKKARVFLRFLNSKPARAVFEVRGFIPQE